MLRQATLHKILGRDLVEKLVQAGWIIRVRDQTGHVMFDERSIRRAVRRLRRGALELDGYARPIVTPARKKRGCDPLADFTTIDFEDELRQFSGPKTKRPINLD